MTKKKKKKGGRGAKNYLAIISCHKGCSYPNYNWDRHALKHVSPIFSIKREAEISLVEHLHKKPRAGGQSLLQTTSTSILSVRSILCMKILLPRKHELRSHLTAPKRFSKKNISLLITI